MIKDSLEEEFHEQYARYLTFFKIEQEKQSDRIYVPNSFGRGYFNRTKLRPGMEVIVADCSLNEQHTLKLKSDVPSIELSFWIKGNSEVNLSGIPLHIQDNHSQLSIMRSINAEMYYKANQPILACEIRIAEAVFLELLDSLGGNSKWDIKHLLANESARVFQQAMQPTEQLIVRQIMSCSLKPPFKKLYLEGKALELLAIYLQKCLLEEEHDKPQSKKGLSRSDLDKIHDAAHILVSQMDQPPSLLELSSLAAISDFKLKMGFKELYGTTVFGYLREKRMEQALYLLENEQISVYEAALATGYSNPSHFASLFRKKYGCNPGQWRK